LGGGRRGWRRDAQDDHTARPVTAAPVGVGTDVQVPVGLGPLTQSAAWAAIGSASIAAGRSWYWSFMVAFSPLSFEMPEPRQPSDNPGAAITSVSCENLPVRSAVGDRVFYVRIFLT